MCNATGSYLRISSSKTLQNLHDVPYYPNIDDGR